MEILFLQVDRPISRLTDPLILCKLHLGSDFTRNSVRSPRYTYEGVAFGCIVSISYLWSGLFA